jgi:ribosome-associated protein
MEKFKIKKDKDYINLTQYLKYINYISSGGEIEHFLSNNEVFLNNEQVKEKRKKIYPGDILVIKGEKHQFTKD